MLEKVRKAVPSGERMARAPPWRATVVSHAVRIGLSVGIYLLVASHEGGVGAEGKVRGLDLAAREASPEPTRVLGVRHSVPLFGERSGEDGGQNRQTAEER